MGFQPAAETSLEDRHAQAQTDPPSGDDIPPLTLVTVYLTQSSMEALANSVRKTGDTRTDTINRALQVYDLVTDLLERSGGQSLVVTYPDGKSERVHIS